jgi:hypothetical protein
MMMDCTVLGRLMVYIHHTVNQLAHTCGPKTLFDSGDRVMQRDFLEIFWSIARLLRFFVNIIVLKNRLPEVDSTPSGLNTPVRLWVMP